MMRWLLLLLALVVGYVVARFYPGIGQAAGLP